MLNLYVRKDLNMRKGKMAAQSGHAGMKLFLDAMKHKDNKLIIEADCKDSIEKFLAKPEIMISMVSDENALNLSLNINKPHALIIDHGRTEFNGVLTKTCAAEGIFTAKYKPYGYEPSDYESGIKAKQILVFSKQFPLSKENACFMAALGCIDMLYQQCDKTNENPEIDLGNKSDFVAWLSGAFAKISLSVKTNEELFVLHNQLKANGIKSLIIEKEENKALIIEPLQPEKIDPFTRNLSLI